MNSYEIKQKLNRAYNHPDYYTNRRKANQKYYSQANNQEAKREYMKEYAKRDYVKAKRKKYLKIYNARPDIKIKRHEWYVNKLIKETKEGSNDNIQTENTVRFGQGV